LFNTPNFISTPHLGASTNEAQVNVALQVAEQMADFLVSGGVTNALNMPSLSAEEAPKLKPYMALAERLGSLVGQLAHDGLTSISVEMEGAAAALNPKPITSAVLAGLMRVHSDTVNMVNAPFLARERGMDVREVRREREGDYHTMVRVTVATSGGERSVAGTLFGNTAPRLVELFGIKVEADLQGDMLYIVNCGFLKSVMIDEFGNEQILSFPMKGDLFGIDGIHTKKYTSEAVALSSCDIILIPFAKFAALGRTNPFLETALYGLMSRELIREQGMITMLGSLTVEARVARFLVSLSERFSAIGYSGKAFNLPMTRREIGNYLGVTLETASRTLSAFNELGLISVDQRSIYIHDINALKTLRRLPPSRARIEQQEKKAAAAAASSEFIQAAPSGAMREQMAVV
jgi:CRP-like cAMP-binding protein